MMTVHLMLGLNRAPPQSTASLSGIVNLSGQTLSFFILVRIYLGVRKMMQKSVCAAVQKLLTIPQEKSSDTDNPTQFNEQAYVLSFSSRGDAAPHLRLIPPAIEDILRIDRDFCHIHTACVLVFQCTWSQNHGN
jgi:hypothetical protein